VRGAAVRAADLRSGRRVIALLGAPPGARVVRTWSGPGDVASRAGAAPGAYEAYVNAHSSSGGYERVFAPTWFVFRTYRRPKRLAAGTILRWYTQALPRWRARFDGLGPPGTPDDEVFLWRRGRCVTVVAARTSAFEVDVGRAPRADC
jgi:hypothetical protein